MDEFLYVTNSMGDEVSQPKVKLSNIVRKRESFKNRWKARMDEASLENGIHANNNIFASTISSGNVNPKVIPNNMAKPIRMMSYNFIAPVSVSKDDFSPSKDCEPKTATNLQFPNHILDTFEDSKLSHINPEINISFQNNFSQAIEKEVKNNSTTLEPIKEPIKEPIEEPIKEPMQEPIKELPPKILYSEFLKLLSNPSLTGKDLKSLLLT